MSTTNDRFTLNQDQLEMIKLSAKESNGCKIWNQWRKENPKTPIVLIGADLQNLNLQGIDLSGYGSDMDRLVVLWEANLSNANFQNANLDYAGLNGTTLEKTNFRRARLKSVDLHGAKSYYSNFEEAYLAKADLSTAKFVGTNFEKADLTCANLGNSNFAEANFDQSILKQACLKEAYLNGANFTDSDLSEVQLDEALICDPVGQVRSAQKIKCSYLNAGKEFDEEYFDFSDESELQFLIELLENGNLEELWKVKMRRKC